MSQSQFTFLIGRLRGALRREFESLVEEYNLTVPQFQVLNHLWQEDGSITSTLATDIGLDGGTVTGILDRLEARELLRRQHGSDDRRKIYLYLTPAGRDLEKPVRRLITELNRRALHGLTTRERNDLMELLGRVETNLKGQTHEPADEAGGR